MSGARLWTAIALLLAACVAMARLPHGERIAPRAPLSTFPARLDGMTAQELPLEARIVAAAGVDDYLNRVYLGPGNPEVGLYVGYYQSQKTGDSVHSPKNCLPGTGWQPLSSTRVQLALAGGRSFPVNLYVVENERRKLLVLYWYQSHGRIVASEYWAKVYTVLDAIRLNRTDTALVRVTVPLENDEEAARRRAMEFAAAAAPELDRSFR